MHFRNTTVSQLLPPAPISHWSLLHSDCEDEPGPSLTQLSDDELTDVATLVSDDSSSEDSDSTSDDDDKEIVATLVAAGFPPRRRFSTPPNVAQFPPDATPVQNAPRRPTRTATRRTRGTTVYDHDLLSTEENEINISPLTGPIRNSAKRRTRFAPTTAHHRFQQSLSAALQSTPTPSTSSSATQTRQGVQEIRHQQQEFRDRDRDLGRLTKEVFTSFFDSHSDRTLGSILRHGTEGEFYDDLMSQVRRAVAPPQPGLEASTSARTAAMLSTPRRRRSKPLQREPTILFDVADGLFWDPRPEGHRADEPLFGVSSSPPKSSFLRSPIRLVEREEKDTKRKNSLRREQCFIWDALP